MAEAHWVQTTLVEVHSLIFDSLRSFEIVPRKDVAKYQRRTDVAVRDCDILMTTPANKLTHDMDGFYTRPISDKAGEALKRGDNNPLTDELFKDELGGDDDGNKLHPNDTRRKIR